MKRIRSGLITLLVLVGINYIVSKSTNTNFIDFSFGIGLIMSVIIWFFTSKGGFVSKYADVTMQSDTTNWKMRNEEHRFHPNVAFYSAILYTIISIVLTFVYYKDYFIN